MRLEELGVPIYVSNPRLLDDVLAFQSGSPRDDVAMLTVTVGPL